MISLLVLVVDVFLSFLLRASSRSEAKLQTRVEVWVEQQKQLRNENETIHIFLHSQFIIAKSLDWGRSKYHRQSKINF